MVKVAVIIVSFNTKLLTLECLKSLLDQNWQTKLEVWVVDNASSDGSVAAIRAQFPSVKVIASPENIGFAAGNNLALKQAKADYYWLLNSDTRVTRGALDKLVEVAKQQHYGIVSAKLLNPDGSFQAGGGELPTLGNVWNWLSGSDDLWGWRSYHLKTEAQFDQGVGWVGGTAMLISQAVVEKIGVLDPAIFMYGEDVEYCLRAARAGFRVGWASESLIVHLGGASSREVAKYNQWLGEFRGLLYIYQTYYGKTKSFLVKWLIQLFIWVRVIIFAILGRMEVAKTYVKVSQNL